MITSGNVPVFSAYWFNTGYMSTSVYGGLLEYFHTLVFQRNAWFDSGFLLMRQITERFTVHTAENCGVSAVAVHQGRRLFLHGAEADFHGLAVQQTIGIPQLQFLNEVIDVPCCAKSFTCPFCATTGALVSVAHQQGRLHPVVPQRLIPMVLFVQTIIEMRVVQVLMGAVVEETVELPRLHLLRNSSSGAAHHRVDELTG